LDSDFSSFDKAYDIFIKNFIMYQELFENSATVDDILCLPYCLFNDIVEAQTKRKVELNKLKQKEIDNMKQQKRR
jgi:hypothetical protein